MELGSFHLMPWQNASENVAWPFSDDEYDPEIGSELYEEYLSHLEYCEELGFDSVGFNEHHYTAYGIMPSPNLIGAALSQRTDDVELMIMGNVLPIRGNPIRVAEEVAMIDNMSDGRVLSGFVRGVPTEYAAYNVDPDESRGRFKEAWDLIVKAWTADEPFDWDGEYWQYQDVNIWPTPKQDPHPELWMPAESQKSIELAAERQVSTGAVYLPTEAKAEIFNEYRRNYRDMHGEVPDNDRFWCTRMVYVAETMEQAREEAEEHLEYFYDTLLGALYRAGAAQQVAESEYRESDSFDYADRAPQKGKKAMNFDFDELQETGEIIVGTPEYVTEEIERQYEELGGFGKFVGMHHFGTLPDDLMRKNLQLFADEVAPEIRKLE